MGIDPKQLMEEAIIPTIDYLGLGGPIARNLIIGTVAQESKGGTYLRQLGAGPALGICQMEPNTYIDIWDSFLSNPKYGALVEKLRCIAGHPTPNARMMVCNLAYSVAMCRIHYYRVKEALPQNLPGIAAYWKKYYNTVKGDGTEAQFLKSFKTYTGSYGLL